MESNGRKRSVLIYMPNELHRWLKAKAALEGRSLSAIIENATRGVYPDAPAGGNPLRISEETLVYNSRRTRKRKKPARTF